MIRKYRNELILLSGFAVLLALKLKDKGSRKKGNRFEGQSVVITGGSRGLGLAIAQALAAEGARLTLLARDPRELERARHKILNEFPAAQVLIINCDVTDTERIHLALNLAAETYGGIDMLVNNAGAITVGPYADMRKEDFSAQMDLHFYAIMQTVNAALPYLRKSQGRRIVNICSIGGKTAVPHMLPYDVSKFALAGYSQGLMAELAREKISVTTVYPTLMSTGSPIQAVFKGDHEKEFFWFAASDALPGLSSSPVSVARKIVRAAHERRAELVPSMLGKIRGVAAALFPETVASVMKLIAALMPQGHSYIYKTGAQSNRRFANNPLTKPLRKINERAEAEFNQEPKTDPGFNMGLR